eukprot:CAMPEP_0113468402 /NCGR_PEP_ID=MMETSP0014_2-20120614/15336_1 /TAXON_ID=2857 /ORGANISM="Nitzschia sp." /LENGTH=2092 /DNA_ID=CAMNT_0000360789 /DNA_START=241 /DNA_END=6519 /DNA_ORIENTATION=- /assembly_acc=CAM_ASM_000159
MEPPSPASSSSSSSPPPHSSEGNTNTTATTDGGLHPDPTTTTFADTTAAMAGASADVEDGGGESQKHEREQEHEQNQPDPQQIQPEPQQKQKQEPSQPPQQTQQQQQQLDSAIGGTATTTTTTSPSSHSHSATLSSGETTNDNASRNVDSHHHLDKSEADDNNDGDGAGAGATGVNHHHPENNDDDLVKTNVKSSPSSSSPTATLAAAAAAGGGGGGGISKDDKDTCTGGGRDGVGGVDDGIVDRQPAEDTTEHRDALPMSNKKNPEGDNTTGLIDDGGDGVITNPDTTTSNLDEVVDDAATADSTSQTSPSSPHHEEKTKGEEPHHQQQQQQPNTSSDTADTSDVENTSLSESGPQLAAGQDQRVAKAEDDEEKGQAGDDDRTKPSSCDDVNNNNTDRTNAPSSTSNTLAVPVPSAALGMRQGAAPSSSTNNNNSNSKGKHQKSFVKKTKRRIAAQNPTESGGVLDALIVDESNRKRASSRMWKIRLVVNECLFPSGAPVPDQPHTIMTATSSLTGSRIRSTKSIFSQKTTRNEAQQLQQMKLKDKGSQKPPTATVSASRRTRSASYDATAAAAGAATAPSNLGFYEGDHDDNLAGERGNIGKKKRRTRGQSQHKQNEEGDVLDAVGGDGEVVPAIPILQHQISHDGNYHYCRICQLTGEVVCCDGCPQVYHRSCMPADEPARITLDDSPDDEEWFCPDCRAKQEGRTSPEWQEEATAVAAKANEATGRLPVLNVASEQASTESVRPGKLAMRTGRGQGRGAASGGRGGSRGGNKRSVLAASQRKAATAAATPPSSQLSPGTPIRKSPMRDAKKNAPELKPDIDDEETENEMTDVEDNNSVDSPDSENESVRSTSLGPALPSRRRGEKSSRRKGRSITNSPTPHQERKKRGRSRSRDDDDMMFDADDKSAGVSSLWTKEQAQRHHDEKKNKRKKKKQRLLASNEASPATPTAASRLTSGDGKINDGTEERSGGIPKATPAFFFFMNENRTKIEKHLARKHKSFQRLPKGIERNALITKEAAAWWKKLEPSDVERFMDMSMQQYEQQIIMWKEDKTIREMMEVEASIEPVSKEAEAEVAEGDEKLTFDNYQRLYRTTNCGYRPFKPSTNESHNRVLLELLHDMRFHPRPMIQVEREAKDYGEMDSDRLTIPYFDVHGPVATSLGDECFGCSRGWAHFCHVLKRRIPSIQHRAKLQPPMSSLMATRVGLGLKDHTSSKQDSSVEEIELFGSRELPEIIESKNLKSPKCNSLVAPSKRADDVVTFIEEIAHMKVSDPPTPHVPTSQEESPQHEHKKKKTQRRVLLPIGRRRAASAEDPDDEGGRKESQLIVHKCGRCREFIEGVTGCIPCRRAQLVINIGSGGDGSSKGNGTIKRNEREVTHQLVPVRTQMIGRLNVKDITTDQQSNSDSAVANHILRERWTPFSILPPGAHESPVRKGRKRTREDLNVNLVEGTSRADMGSGHQVNSRIIVGSKNETGDLKIKNEPESGRSSRSSPTGDIENELIDLEDKRQGRVRTRGKTGGIGSAAGRNSPIFEFDDRPQLSQKLKDKNAELNKKMVSVACYGIYLAMVRRDPLLLFADPPEKEAEGYTAIIQKPVDFSQIRGNLLSGNYATLGAFVADARLLCTNALYFNAPGTIYAKTAKELLDVLTSMHRRATNWMTTLRDAVALAVRQAYKSASPTMFDDVQKLRDNKFLSLKELLSELRQEWPKAVEMLENENSLRRQVELDFRRTRENEIAYYSAVAVRRAATAASVSLAEYPDSGGAYNPVIKRSYLDDEKLRGMIAKKVGKTVLPPQLKDIPTWREDAVVKLLRKAQNRRVEAMSDNLDGCARVDGINGSETHYKIATSAEALSAGKKRKHTDRVRVAKSRQSLTTGVSSKALRDLVTTRRAEFTKQVDERGVAVVSSEHVDDAAVSVKGSGIHGWGLFADLPFNKGDFVAEYIGEYVSPAVTDAREKLYQQQRIQDYQFRLDDALVIDATMRGGHGRYINHSCSPNCVAKIVPGDPPNEHLKRVIIVADRDIEPLEEFSYDYQFPLEEDLDARIPCNCQSESCRGFMNWDLPEKGANAQELVGRKRANIRDRIRRLGRPLKK